MLAASDLMEWYFDWPLQLPVPSDTSWGSSMAEDSYIDGVAERASEIRAELRTLYMDSHVPGYEA